MTRLNSLGIKNALTHGQTYTRTWNSWRAMRNRCRRSDSPYYGTHIEQSWDSYEKFLEDMGQCPPGMSLDRIDNSKGYSAANCRWATRKQQTDNRSFTHRLSDGRIAADVCRANGVKQSTFNMRLRTGWSVDRAATTPPRLYRSSPAASGASQPQP